MIIDSIPKSYEERPFGPHPVKQVARVVVDAELIEAGFKMSKVHDFLTEQYFVEHIVAED